MLEIYEPLTESVIDVVDINTHFQTLAFDRDHMILCLLWDMILCLLWDRSPTWSAVFKYEINTAKVLSGAYLGICNICGENLPIHSAYRQSLPLLREKNSKEKALFVKFCAKYIPINANEEISTKSVKIITGGILSGNYDFIPEQIALLKLETI